MTFRDATYVGDMLVTAGLRNIFGDQNDRDFFEVALDDVRRRRPSLVLLPDEPYVFAEKHARELEDAGIDATFVLLCGKNLSWYGPRTPVAIEQIAADRQAGGALRPAARFAQPVHMGGLDFAALRRDLSRSTRRWR